MRYYWYIYLDLRTTKKFWSFWLFTTFPQNRSEICGSTRKTETSKFYGIYMNLKGFHHCQPMQHVWAENQFGAVDMTWRLGSRPAALLCAELICCMVQCTPSIDPNLGCQTSGSARLFLVGFKRVLAVSNGYPFG